MNFKNAAIKYKIGFIFVTVVLLVLPNFFQTQLIPVAKNGYDWEEFEPGLTPKIQTVSQLIARADSIASTQQIETGSQAYVEALNDLIKKRFYHGYSHYGLHDNWIAAVLGRLTWEHLSAVVLPDDILKYPMAACSQQSIVLMEALKQKNITYRKVGFDGHFALEAKVNQEWLFFDPNMEPEYTSEVLRSDIRSLINNDLLYTIYRNRLDSFDVMTGLSNQFYGVPNAAPAPRASLFHQVTKFASKWIFLLPIVVLLLFTFFKKRNNKKENSPNINFVNKSGIRHIKDKRTSSFAVLKGSHKT